MKPQMISPKKEEAPKQDSTISKIAIRHLAVKFDKKLKKQMDLNQIATFKETANFIPLQITSEITEKDEKDESSLQCENNFTFENREETIPSPQNKTCIQEPKPELEMFDSKYCGQQTEEKEHCEVGSYCGNMFESFHTSDEECDGKSDELCESSINLDITNCRVEMYEDQLITQQKGVLNKNKVYETEDYVMIPVSDKNRMISIPKNEKYVKISDMLSRSFVRENSELKQSESFSTEMFNPLNCSLRLDESSPIKIQLTSTNDKLKRLQNEVLQSMELEHIKIVNSKKSTSILKNKLLSESEGL